MSVLLLVGTSNVPIVTPSLAGEVGYVGYKVCAACHKEQAAHWKTTGHYTASEVLSEGQKIKRQCMSCHGTGAGMGNFGKKWEKVQCESCHGPGKGYIKLKTKWKEDPVGTRKLALERGFRLQKEWRCLRCHGWGRPGGHARIFNYEQAYKRIAHIEKRD